MHRCMFINRTCPVLRGGLRSSIISELVLAPGATCGKSPTLSPHRVIAICCGRSQALFPYHKLFVNRRNNVHNSLLRRVSDSVTWPKCGDIRKCEQMHRTFCCGKSQTFFPHHKWRLSIYEDVNKCE